ncbi:DUF1893 domain-containing protein [Anaerotignum lactatifermentans]|uniref:DUF1893 domain-containing protein n=1 Tax=Anaerotignum lactatifermentans TaxID=160404 RepID=A0ABS2GCX1_9FIRM|nr:DUF1893 domain-containing protein [Anaerotignum lactatifermentans]MBM6830138.1 DUF1893 domain-containing protein [Anaerotignum lactatifermentans]MBM6878717.1 DUF1893 domain-containing protein [Anaerotignum lactatifermentans]MBM6951751.1 DUF1893 domain-containing protein [Anaerotignum lactatifermentans]
MEALERAKAALEKEGVTFSLAGAKGESCCSAKKGIAPMMELLAEDAQLLRGAAVADRVIGKAAAFLMVYGGVLAVYGEVMSEHAAKVLEAAGMDFSYGKLVPYIINRNKDGMCPMEQAVLGETEPERAYAVLRRKTEEGR